MKLIPAVPGSVPVIPIQLRIPLCRNLFESGREQEAYTERLADQLAGAAAAGDGVQPQVEVAPTRFAGGAATGTLTG